MSAAFSALLALDTFWNKILPVNVEQIAKDMGVRVIKSIGIDGDWDISGKLSFDGTNPVCTINSTDSEQRQRFTLAHELGHYCLKHGDKIDRTENLYRKNYGYQNSQETEANAFAAELLMPKSAIDYCIQEKKIQCVASLAVEFNVSERAMEIRLINTGWI